MTIGRFIMAASAVVTMGLAGPSATMAAGATLGMAMPDTTVITPHRLAWVTPTGELATAGKDLKVRTFPWPTPCGDVADLPSALRAANDDELLLDCSTAPGQLNAVVVNATTGAVAPATTVPPALGYPESAVASSIGREWLAVGVSGYHYALTVYVSRRDGHVEMDSGAARQQPDLDRRTLMAPLCSPLRRQPTPDAGGVENVDERFSLDVSGRLALDIYGGRAPTLQRCGSRTKKHLPCRTRCRGTTIADGAVAWMRGQVAHVLVPSTGRRTQTRMDHGRFVALLGGRLVVIETGGAVWRLRSTVRVPRRSVFGR